MSSAVSAPARPGLLHEEAVRDYEIIKQPATSDAYRTVSPKLRSRSSRTRT